MVHPIEFKKWLNDCIENARNQGMTEEEILLALLEETHSQLLRVHNQLDMKLEKKENET